MSKMHTLSGLGVAAVLMAACSSGGTADPTTSPTPTAATTPPAPAPSSASSSISGPSAPTSPSSGGPTETIFASLCDEATPEQIKVIEGAMRPGFTVSQLVDVRTDEKGTHAILGFVEGPGVAVLAQWTGKGLDLKGLAAADEFSTETSTAPPAPVDGETEQLLGATVQCYTLIFAEGS